MNQRTKTTLPRRSASASGGELNHWLTCHGGAGASTTPVVSSGSPARAGAACNVAARHSHGGTRTIVLARQILQRDVRLLVELAEGLAQAIRGRGLGAERRERVAQPHLGGGGGGQIRRHLAVHGEDEPAGDEVVQVALDGLLGQARARDQIAAEHRALAAAPSVDDVAPAAR